MIIKVVAAIIRNHKEEILFAQRSLDATSCAGLWEFPGGKISDSESEEQALKRELTEELSMVVEIEHAFATSIYRENHNDGQRAKEIHLKSYLVRALSDNYELRVHEKVLWLKKEKAQNLHLAPADIPIYEKLLVTNWP